MSKTLRILYPQWQGGENPDYVFGAELLSHIAPPGKAAETVGIHVDTNFDKKRNIVDGIAGGDDILANMTAVRAILEEKQPEKVIVYGGECSVTQAPFDYLSGKYGDKIGIIWLDSHPDISSTQESSHMNECVLGNLVGRGQECKVTRVEHPYPPERVMMAGLIEEDLRDMDKGVKELGIRIVTPERLKKSSKEVLDWIHNNGLNHVAIHWDLDVTSMGSFRSTYPTEPYLDPNTFPAAIGRMELKELERFFTDVAHETEIVGLSITEHMPWDAMNLRRVMSGISIFNG